MEKCTHAGLNSSGELGTRDNINKETFEKAKTELEDLTEIISIGRASGEAGNVTSGVIKENGRVYTSGANENGSLGDGTDQNRNYFKEVMYKTVDYEEKIKLYVGETFELTNENFKLNKNYLNVYIEEKEEISFVNTAKILDEDIVTYENGLITANKIGKTLLYVAQEDIKIYIPVEVVPEGAEIVPDVEAGDEFNIALRANGEIWSFGKNSNGELGLGDNENRNYPEQITLDQNEKIRDIAVRKFTCNSVRNFRRNLHMGRKQRRRTSEQVMNKEKKCHKK
ncbi:MAG: hypothetical protein HFJ50_06840 [Clostridia bacterium]|jgi:alpha-tubulin suppressor-like RCC1 family protein|nr:hypothetical protein [Clostridia bacterium]